MVPKSPNPLFYFNYISYLCGMKNFILLFVLAFVSSCTPSLTEQDKMLQKDVKRLSVEVNKLVDSVDQHVKLCDSLQKEISVMEVKKNVYQKGKTPVYILTLHFQEHKMELSWDRISFDFEVPVDEYFYNECKVGEQIGSGRRTMKLLHSGDITISDKRIDYR
jgi:hypothetical protein